MASAREDAFSQVLSWSGHPFHFTRYTLRLRHLLRGDTLHFVFLVAHVAIVTLAGVPLLQAALPSKLAPAEPNTSATIDHHVSLKSTRESTYDGW